jgi:hypothetical protein
MTGNTFANENRLHLGNLTITSPQRHDQSEKLGRFNKRVHGFPEITVPKVSTAVLTSPFSFQPGHGTNIDGAFVVKSDFCRERGDTRPTGITATARR